MLRDGMSSPLWFERFRSSMRSSIVLDVPESNIPRAAKFLQKGVRILAKTPIGRPHRQTLVGQPYDDVLLAASPLFRKSRLLFVERGGTFHPALLSSLRALSSPKLIDMDLEYTPIASEIVWRAEDPVEKSDPMSLWALRPLTTCLFHEQTHRLIWTLLPPPSAGENQLRRYLNLCEAKVVAIDAALGDELGSGTSEFFYLAGVSYNPGSELKKRWKPTARQYRNYLQAYMYGAYLVLEDFDHDGIRKLIPALFPTLGEYAHHAAERATRLDERFVRITNPIWQKRHARKVRERKIRPAGNLAPIELPAVANDNRVAYLYFEKLLDLLEI